MPLPEKALLGVARTRFRRSLHRRTPATAAGRTDFQAIAGMEFNADFLGTQLARLASLGQQPIMMRLAIFAAEHAAGAVTCAVAGGVALRRLLRFQNQIEGNAETAAILSVAARTGAEFMPRKMQLKPGFRDFEAAEFQAADRVPFADRGPAVAAR